MDWSLEEVNKKLAEQRRLLLRGSVNGKSQEMLCTMLLMLDIEKPAPIRLEIDSGGGDADMGRYISDTIRSLQSVVVGVVAGYAGSAAFTVLQSCDIRVAWPNGQVMFHSVSTSIEVGKADLSFRLQSGKRLNEKNLVELAERSGQPLKKLRQWSRQARVWSADEALQLGFIDQIEYPKPKLRDGVV